MTTKWVSILIKSIVLSLFLALITLSVLYYPHHPPSEGCTFCRQKKALYTYRKKPGRDRGNGSSSLPRWNLQFLPISAPCLYEPLFGSSSMVSMETARSWRKTAGRVLFYDEIIDRQDTVAFPEDFRFEIPDEVASIELY